MIRIPTHPGEMLLEEFLKPLKVAPIQLAKQLGLSRPRVNELIRGKLGVTLDTALGLERLFGMEAQFWLNLKKTWDLYHVSRSPVATQIQKIQRLSTLSRNLKQQSHVHP